MDTYFVPRAVLDVFHSVFYFDCVSTDDQNGE